MKYRGISDIITNVRGKPKATKKEVLKFIDTCGTVTYQMISQHFGYSEGVAANCLTRLKKQYLIINLLRGEWILTARGDWKLAYYRRKEAEERQSKKASP